MELPYTLRQFKSVLHGLGYHLEPDELDGNRSNNPVLCHVCFEGQGVCGGYAPMHGFHPCTPQNKNDNPLDLRTQAAIREFQANYRLPITGTADRLTQETARQLIRNLQHSLNLTLNAQLPVSEFFGPLTSRAVQHFQQQQGLTCDGVASARVRHLLDESVKQKMRHQVYCAAVG